MSTHGYTRSTPPEKVITVRTEPLRALTLQDSLRKDVLQKWRGRQLSERDERDNGGFAARENAEWQAVLTSAEGEGIINE
jgi:hypothetical protein